MASAYLTGHLGLGPHKGGSVEDVEVIQPLIPIMTPVEVDLVTVHRGRVIIPASGNRPEGLRLRPIDSNVTQGKPGHTRSDGQGPGCTGRSTRSSRSIPRNCTNSCVPDHRSGQPESLEKLELCYLLGGSF